MSNLLLHRLLLQKKIHPLQCAGCPHRLLCLLDLLFLIDLLSIYHKIMFCTKTCKQTFHYKLITITTTSVPLISLFILRLPLFILRLPLFILRLPLFILRLPLFILRPLLLPPLLLLLLLLQTSQLLKNKKKPPTSFGS